VCTTSGTSDKDSFVKAARDNDDFPSVAIVEIEHFHFRLQQHLGINIPNLEQSNGHVAINSGCIPK
jgi:hypothetical protein